MIRYSDYRAYMELYVKGVSRVEIKNYTYRTEKGELLPDLRETFDKTTLFFTSSGKLMFSKHVCGPELKSMCTYSYCGGNPVSILQVSLHDLNWQARSDFIYDEHKRIALEVVNTNLKDAINDEGTRYYHQYKERCEIEYHKEEIEGLIDDEYKWMSNYDDAGRLIEEIALCNEEIMYHCKNVFSDKGFLEREQELDADGVILSETELIYENGYLVCAIKNDGLNKEVWKYVYEFDKNGNWLTKLRIINDIPENVIVRNLFYR